MFYNQNQDGRQPSVPQMDEESRKRYRHPRTPLGKLLYIALLLLLGAAAGVFIYLRLN